MQKWLFIWLNWCKPETQQPIQTQHSVNPQCTSFTWGGAGVSSSARRSFFLGVSTRCRRLLVRARGSVCGLSGPGCAGFLRRSCSPAWLLRGYRSDRHGWRWWWRCPGVRGRNTTLIVQSGVKKKVCANAATDNREPTRRRSSNTVRAAEKEQRTSYNEASVLWQLQLVGKYISSAGIYSVLQTPPPHLQRDVLPESDVSRHCQVVEFQHVGDVVKPRKKLLNLQTIHFFFFKKKVQASFSC